MQFIQLKILNIFNKILGIHRNDPPYPCVDLPLQPPPFAIFASFCSSPFLVIGVCALFPPLVSSSGCCSTGLGSGPSRTPYSSRRPTRSGNTVPAPVRLRCRRRHGGCAAFDDSSWTDAPAPVYYSTSATEPPFYTGGAITGTAITGMQNTFSCIFLRKTFTVANPAVISELRLEAACDDGFIAWINGVEATRYNVPDAAPAYNAFAGNSISEPAPLGVFTITNTSMLTAGVNVLAVQVFNSTLNSSDLGFMAGLTAPVDVTAPAVATLAPPAGATTGELTRIEVTFREMVFGVDAADLRLNLTPAASVSGTGAGPYAFEFPQPAAGAVSVTWACRPRHCRWFRQRLRRRRHGVTHSTPPSWCPRARITEVMASNSNTLTDEDGDDSDWLEILNPRQTTLALGDWFLTDDADNLTKWRFPAVSLAPGARLVVFASGKDRGAAGRAVAHELLALCQWRIPCAGGRRWHDAWFRSLRRRFRRRIADRSYGAVGDDGPDAYLLTPTPGAANSVALGAALVADTKFLPGRGLYDAPVSVAITTETPGAAIRYTTNGSLPTANHRHPLCRPDQREPHDGGPRGGIQIRLRAIECGHAHLFVCQRRADAIARQRRAARLARVLRQRPADGLRNGLPRRQPQQPRAGRSGAGAGRAARAALALHRAAAIRSHRRSFRHLCQCRPARVGTRRFRGTAQRSGARRRIPCRRRPAHPRQLFPRRQQSQTLVPPSLPQRIRRRQTSLSAIWQRRRGGI